MPHILQQLDVQEERFGKGTGQKERERSRLMPGLITAQQKTVNHYVKAREQRKGN